MTTHTRTGRPQRMVALPPERHDQLTRLADQRGQTLAEVIGGFLDREVAEGRLSPDLPGVSISRDDDGRVRVDLGDVQMILSDANTHKVAEMMRKNADRAARRSTMSDAELSADIRAWAREMKEEIRAKIERRGKGVRIEGQNGAVHSLEPGVARSIATMIENA